MTVYPIWIKIKHVLFGSPIISNCYSNLFYNFHVTQHKCQNSSWILIRQALKFIVEPRWQHALLKQPCVDTVPSYASKFASRTPNGTTSPTCRAPSYPATHSHRLLKILDAVAEQSICCLLALTVFLLGFHNLLRILGMMSSVWSMGNSTSQLSQWQRRMVLSCSDELRAMCECVVPSGWCWTVDGWGC